MNKTPKVTVLMPVYNGEKYLREAIDSILNQTFKDFEFLIINDGSTDSSQTIVESYDDPRIHLINQKNKGLSETLNIGLDLSNGEYIARMDADDISMNNRLSEQVSFMDKNRDVGICGTFAIIIDKNGHGIGRIVSPQKHEEIKAQLLFNTSLAHPSVIFRKSIFKIHNLQYLNVKSEDYELWVRSANITKLANINKFLIKYRYGVGISENINKNKCISSTNEIIKKNLLSLGEFSEQEILTHERMFDGSYVPDNIFLKQSIFLLNKIRLANEKVKLYQTEALDFSIIIKWFYVCARMNKLKLFFSFVFWLNSLKLFFKLSLKQKISLIKLANAKLGLIN
jgi:glycosyltransferase involved in cell wall biosynthesis